MSPQDIHNDRTPWVFPPDESPGMNPHNTDRRLHLLSTLLETSVDLHRIATPRALATLAARTLQGQFGIMKVALYVECKGALRALVAPASDARALRTALAAGADCAPWPTVVRSAGRGRTLITALGPSLTGATLGPPEIAFVVSLAVRLLARRDPLDYVKSQRERASAGTDGLAREIQRDLLPTLPDVEGWDLDYHFAPLHR